MQKRLRTTYDRRTKRAINLFSSSVCELRIFLRRTRGTNSATVKGGAKQTVMNDLNKMRLGVLRELKNVHKFLDNMERSVKTRNPQAIQRAYVFLVHLVREMDVGILTPDSIALDVELYKALQEDYEKSIEE